MKNKIIILAIILILMGTGSFMWYKSQRNQEIHQYCFKASKSKIYSVSPFELWGFSSIDNCVSMIKNMGGIKKFKESFNEVLENEVLRRLAEGQVQLPEGITRLEFMEQFKERIESIDF